MSSEQSKEYIITEKQLDRVDRCYIEDCDGGCPNSYCPIDIAKEVRSRPYTAPLAKENLTVGMVYAYEAGEREGARKAREQVLKEIEVLEKKVYFAIPRADPKGDYIYPGRAETRIAYKTVAFWIEELKESLRAQQAGVSE